MEDVIIHFIFFGEWVRIVVGREKEKNQRRRRMSDNQHMDGGGPTSGLPATATTTRMTMTTTLKIRTMIFHPNFKSLLTFFHGFIVSLILSHPIGKPRLEDNETVVVESVVAA
jgi:hypothetical protein